MIGRAVLLRLPRRPGLAATGALALLLAALTGCNGPQTRGQSEDEADKENKYEVKTVGDYTTVSGADPLPLGGVGLVTGLAGTGGGAPPGSYRTFLEHELQRKEVPHLKELLSSPDVSLVLVSAQIPPGAHKGDPLDVEITVPGNSRTTSLHGGRLEKCFLYNYESARNLSPDHQAPDRAILGHPVAVAEGPLLVGFGDGDEAARQRQGRIWGGARTRIDQPFYLILNDKDQYARVASMLADRINETFHSSYHGAGASEIAHAKNKTFIALGVPAQYKHNLQRYLRVVRLIPVREDGPGGHNAYRRRLEEDLLDPANTVIAALRLEALGRESIPALKRGLQSDRQLVRFTSAEALAYLGNPACGEELARIVRDQPQLRSYALTALASLDEAVCHVKLRELLDDPRAEVRYGAFRALRALDEHDPVVQGELLNESFWLHRVAPNTPGLVHLSSSRRAEIVLFGEDAWLKPPFSLSAGDFTVTAGRDDPQCTVCRFSPQHGVLRKQCPARLEDVLRTLADEGAAYPEAVEVLRQVRREDCLTCRIEADALPQATSVQALAQAARDLKAGRELSEDVDPALFKPDEDVLNARNDLGATPSLFERGLGRRLQSQAEQDEASLLRQRKKDDTKSAQRRPQSGE